MRRVRFRNWKRTVFGAWVLSITISISEFPTGRFGPMARLTQPVEMSCVSCLEKFVHEIKVPAFAIHMELHGPETVDLSPLIREDLLLNLPAYPHCDREGDRKCKATIPPPAEAESKRKPDWSALDKLK